MARILKLGVYDPAYLTHFYGDRPQLVGQPYAVQHRALIADRAASSDFWTSALARLGHETDDTIANAGPLQRQWAAENGAGFDADRFVFKVTLAQIRALRPEVLLVADHSTFTAAFLRTVRAELPALLIVGWCGAPYRDLGVLREWDVALSCIPAMVADFRAIGLDAHHVDHAFSPDVLDQIGPVAADPVPFSFVGSVIDRAGYHGDRATLLRTMVDRTPIRIFSAAGSTRPGRSLRGRVRRLLGRGEGQLAPAIRARTEPAVYGLAMFRRLRDSAVTLNNHIAVSAHNASNLRLFEATGVGTCLLTDAKPDLARLFEPDHEVVTYASAAEAVEKYRFLAADPAARQDIAAAGQRRALRDHGFDQRAARIDEILRQRLSRR